MGYKAFISNRAEELSRAKALILPGVGAFPDAMKNLKEEALDLLIKDFVKDNKPILGICLECSSYLMLAMRLRNVKA